MEKLQAVNQVMLALGQRTVTSLDTPHPVKDAIIAKLRYELNKLLRAGWYFNTRCITLYPDDAGNILRPTAVLALANPLDVDFVGQYLTSTTDGSRTFTMPRTVLALVQLDFEELPDAAAELLVCTLVVSMYLSEYGDDNTLRQHTATLQDARSALRREEVRRLPPAAHTNSAFARIARAVRGGY